LKNERETMLREFEDDGIEYFGSGRCNNISDIACSVGAIVSSIAAAVLAALSHTRPWVVAFVAAIPAGLASAQVKINFRGRSDWYFESAARVRDLAGQLKYAEAPDLAEFARKRGELEIAGEEKWKAMGRLRGQGQ
jgi:hypothetical protein